MRYIRRPRSYVGVEVFILLNDASCDCTNKCVPWIILAAIIPPLIIASIAAVVKWCTWMNRKRSIIDSAANRDIEEKVDEPVYDYQNEFDNSVPSSPQDLSMRRKKIQGVSPGISVSATAEVVSEQSRKDSVSEMESGSNKTHRKKIRKLTDLNKVSTSSNVETAHSTRSDSMRNMFSLKQRSEEKTAKSMKDSQMPQAFSNLESVLENESGATEHYTTSEEEGAVGSVDSQTVTKEHSGNVKSALDFLDEAIAFNKNDEGETADESDLESNDFQVLSDKLKTERQRHSTPSPAANILDISRPNSPVTDEDVLTSSVPLSGTPETLYRSVTPFPFLSARKTKPKRNSKSINRTDIIEETEEEDSLSTEKIIRESAVIANEPNNTNTKYYSKPTDTKRDIVKSNFPKDMLKQRSVTPMPFSNITTILSVTRSKTPDPFVTKHQDSRIIKVAEKQRSPISSIPSHTKEPPANLPSSNLLNGSHVFFNKKGELSDNNKHLQTPEPGTQEPLSISDSRVEVSRSKRPDPFITDHSHSRLNIQQTIKEESDKAVEKHHALKDSELSDSRYLSRRSQTPDLFDNEQKSRAYAKETRRRRSKRLDKLLTYSSELKDTNDMPPSHEVFNDTSLSELIREASRRAATPDPDTSEQTGLVYNKHFAKDVKRSKSVNIPSRSDKLQSSRGSSSNYTVTDKHDESQSENKRRSDNLFSQHFSGRPDTQLRENVQETPRTDTSEKHRMPFLQVQNIANKKMPGNDNDELRDRHNQIESDNDKRNSTRAREDTFDELLHSIENRSSTHGASETRSFSSMMTDSASTDNASRTGDKGKFESTAAKLRAKRQNQTAKSEILEDVTFQSLTKPSFKPQSDFYDSEIHRSTFSLQGVFREKPQQSSVLPSTGMLNTTRMNPFSPTSTPVFSRDFSQTTAFGSRETTFSEKEDFQTKTDNTSVHRSESINERTLFKFEPGTSGTSEEDTRRKRKRSPPKLQLPDLAAVPRKSILKKTTSPSSESRTAIDVFPLSQLVSSGKDREANPSLTEKFFQPGKSRSIMFAGSPTMFGDTEPGDNKVQRSLSYNERRHTHRSVSERPPTPAVSKSKRSNKNWNMSSTKF